MIDARHTMACFNNNRHETTVDIPEVIPVDNYMSYHIIVKIGDIYWSVYHRYSDFAELHDKLVSEHSVPKDILPPKKVIGNKEPTFLEKRRSDLCQYLRTVLNFLQIAMPLELAVFLDFHRYDTQFLIRHMAIQFYDQADNLLELSRSFTFNPLQVRWYYLLSKLQSSMMLNHLKSLSLLQCPLSSEVQKRA